MLDSIRNYSFIDFFLFAAGVCLIVPGLFMGWDGVVLAQEHASTTGEHVSTRVKSGTTESGMYGQNDRTVTATVDVVGFHTQEGEWVTFETTVPSTYENGEMPIIYSPDSPKTACIEPCKSLETGGLLFGAGTFAIMLGFGLRMKRKADE